MSTAFHCRFGLGDEVYFMKDNQVRCGNVVAIFITHRVPEETGIAYALKTQVCAESIFKQAQLFGSKKELLESL